MMNTELVEKNKQSLLYLTRVGYDDVVHVP